MVITKDLSRLGRNMAQSMIFATEYFPKKNVRYYAISDDYDSFDKHKDNNKLKAEKGLVYQLNCNLLLKIIGIK